MTITKERQFVIAAKVLGYHDFRIIINHILPNIISPLIVISAANFAASILIESGLSFLGLGIQPPMSSWGTLIRYGVESMEEYSWLLIYPGLTFTITLFALNFFGDGLRDALDPKISSD